MPKQEKITLNKYGRMRLNYLKENKKAEYSMILMDEILNSHLKEIQETTTERVEQIIKQLKSKSNLTEDMKNTIKFCYFFYLYDIILVRDDYLHVNKISNIVNKLNKESHILKGGF